MTRTRIHPVSGEVLSRATRRQVVSFGSLSRQVEVPGWYPDGDSASIPWGAELGAKEEALGELRAA